MCFVIHLSIQNKLRLDFFSIWNSHGWFVSSAYQLPFSNQFVFRFSSASFPDRFVGFVSTVIRCCSSIRRRRQSFRPHCAFLYCPHCVLCHRFFTVCLAGAVLPRLQPILFVSENSLWQLSSLQSTIFPWRNYQAVRNIVFVWFLSDTRTSKRKRRKTEELRSSWYVIRISLRSCRRGNIWRWRTFLQSSQLPSLLFSLPQLLRALSQRLCAVCNRSRTPEQPTRLLSRFLIDFKTEVFSGLSLDHSVNCRLFHHSYLPFSILHQVSFLLQVFHVHVQVFARRWR